MLMQCSQILKKMEMHDYFQNFFSASIQSTNELYAQVDLKTKRNNRASTESSGGLIDSTILTEVNLNQVLKFEKV